MDVSSDKSINWSQNLATNQHQSKEDALKRKEKLEESLLLLKKVATTRDKVALTTIITNTHFFNQFACSDVDGSDYEEIFTSMYHVLITNPVYRIVTGDNYNILHWALLGHVLLTKNDFLNNLYNVMLVLPKDRLKVCVNEKSTDGLSPFDCVIHKLPKILEQSAYEFDDSSIVRFARLMLIWIEILESYSLDSLQQSVTVIFEKYLKMAASRVVNAMTLWDIYQKILEKCQVLSRKTFVIISSEKGYFKLLGGTKVGPLARMLEFIGFENYGNYLFAKGEWSQLNALYLQSKSKEEWYDYKEN